MAMTVKLMWHTGFSIDRFSGWVGVPLPDKMRMKYSIPPPTIAMITARRTYAYAVLLKVASAAPQEASLVGDWSLMKALLALVRRTSKTIAMQNWATRMKKLKQTKIPISSPATKVRRPKRTKEGMLVLKLLRMTFN